MTNRKPIDGLMGILAKIAVVAIALPAFPVVSGAEPEAGPSPKLRQTLGLDQPALSAVNAELPKWLRLSGELRFRSETRHGMGFTDSNEDAYGLFRTRLNVEIEPSEHVRFFFQGQDSRAPGILPARANGVFRDPFDVRQAYVEIGSGEDGPVTVTAGRQLLIYGDQRLVGALDWTNTSRTFDAVKLSLKSKPFKLDLFSAQVAQNDPGRRINQSLEGNNLHGAYVQWTTPLKNTVFEPFVLWQTNPSVLVESAAPGDMDRVSFGFRVAAKALAGWDYSATLVGQRGSMGGADINAEAVSVQVGHTFDVAARPRVFLEYNYASGDDDPTDNSIGWFSDIYPTAHLYYGYNDLVGWRNIKNLRLGMALNPVRKLKLNIDFHSFWLANRHDNLYNVAGNISVRPGPELGVDTKVGDEVNVTLATPVNKSMTLGGGIGYF